MFKVMNINAIYETASDAVYDAIDDAVCDGMLDGAYDEWIDELDGDVHIGGGTYSASRVLEAVDPIAYRCGMDDFTNWLAEDMVYDLEHTGSVDMYGIEIIEVKYYTAAGETGDTIDEVGTVEEGLELIKEYEEDDKENGTFEPHFYDVVDEDGISQID